MKQFQIAIIGGGVIGSAIARELSKYDANIVKNNTPGIWSHTSVRKDKQDTYPDDRLMAMLNRIKKKVNG